MNLQENQQQETIMSTEEKLQALKNEIIVAMSEALNDSQLIDFLESHDLVDQLAKTEFVIDTKKMKSNEKLDIDLQIKNDLEESSTNERGDSICKINGIWRRCCARGRLMFLM